MKQSLILNDYKTEFIFSLLRWIFLIAVVFLFYHPELSALLQFEKYSFHVLLVIGLIYMTVTQIALYKLAKEKSINTWILHLGILFDYMALIWLVALTDGANSPLFPIAFLIIMHATIYWSIRGALLSTFAILIGFTLVVLLKGQFSDIHASFHYYLNIGFLLIVGLFGALITYRERTHLREKKEFHELVVKDYLTGLFNHRTFQQELKKVIASRKSFYLCMTDIDYFKEINDKFGHVSGDEVLKEIGNILSSTIPTKSGLAFRYGGEEFALIIQDSSEEKVKKMILAIYQELSNVSLVQNGEIYRVTMSFGVSKHRNEDAGDIVKKADELLYVAKHQGRNRAIFDDHSVLVNRNNLLVETIAK
ncbi:GGDEF domain-containing protein [Litchfieldia alkalitelluris]|uniref:GGDEF domain-containing protein n=1 Tax=Litchfieldia alkalitelluris TaxID=304268 RepID=UPI00099755A2|nr:GGDEF domain-containing protein [Litchfieldia alkalitelluris]